MEQVKKVVRLNGNPIESEAEVDDDDEENEPSDMDKLPNEVLMKILGHLTERQLVKCRLLSSRWNEICCLLLQEKSKKNPSSKLIVQITKAWGDCYMECETVIKRPLDKFLDCFCLSEGEEVADFRRRPFPFSRFGFSGVHAMSRNDMTRLVSIFIHIKSLLLEVTYQQTTNVALFWRLLLKFAPHVEHLGFAGTSAWGKVDFFEPYFNFKTKSDPLQKVNNQNQDDTFLTKLKTIEIVLARYDYRLEPSIVETLDRFIEHLPNIQELICHNSAQFRFLQLWQGRFKKPHLLKKLELNNYVVLESKTYEPPGVVLKNLQLENLRAQCNMPSHSKQNDRALINYIHHAITSSWNSLSTLDLYNLTLESMNFCFQDISSLPNVRHLKLEIDNPSEIENILDQFSQLCSNVTTFSLDLLHHDYLHVARILWTRFKGLKSLKLLVKIVNERDNSLALDSVFSGYSKDSIARIQSKLKNGISLEEAREGESQEASILELKDLSRLELKFLLGRRSPQVERLRDQLQNSIFIKILPQYIRENPRSDRYLYVY